MAGSGGPDRCVAEQRREIAEFWITWQFAKDFLEPAAGYSDLGLAWVLVEADEAERGLELVEAIIREWDWDAGLLPPRAFSVRLLAVAKIGVELDGVVEQAGALLEADAHDLDARQALAIALAKTGRMQEARVQFDWLVTQKPDDYQTLLLAARTYRVLALEAQQAGEPLPTIEDLCSRALALYAGNGNQPLMQFTAADDEEVQWVLQILGQSAYDTAVATGSPGLALPLLHGVESRSPIPIPLVVCGLTEAYIDSARSTGDPRATAAAKKYIAQLRAMDVLDQQVIAQMEAMLPC